MKKIFSFELKTIFIALILGLGALFQFALAVEVPANLDPGAILNAEKFNASQKSLFYGNLEALIKPPEAVIIDEQGILPKDLQLNGVIIEDSIEK